MGSISRHNQTHAMVIYPGAGPQCILHHLQVMTFVYEKKTAIASGLVRSNW